VSLIKLYCTDCQSECEVYSEMDEHHYPIQHCPFCGAEIDEHQREELDDETE
jgi:hypothetical protein